MTTRVKICGLKREAHLDAALEAGADLVGLVLYSKSPRHLTIAEAAALARRAHERSQAHVVTLLVDADDALIDRVAAEIKPDMLQLHGQETVARVREIRARTGLGIMKAVAVADAADVTSALTYVGSDGAADLILFDAKVSAPEALPGGNGLTFDWHILDPVKGRMLFALAGGLTPETVAAAIELTGADIVDVSSGVESRPGEKDPELIRRFLQAAKAAKQQAKTSLPPRPLGRARS